MISKCYRNENGKRIWKRLINSAVLNKRKHLQYSFIEIVYLPTRLRAYRTGKNVYK